jgi:2-dehydropantoate 2-reductase
MVVISRTNPEIKLSQPILIVGSGAMACLFAARFCASSQRVCLLGSWAEGISTLESQGVTLVNDQEKRNYPVSVARTPEECLGSRLALVLEKSWQTTTAAERLSKCLADDGIALTLQNGLGNLEILVEKLGAERVFAGAVTFGATLLQPGVVRQNGIGRVDLPDHRSLAGFYSAIEKTGIQINRLKDIDSLLWGKLLLNAAINPLTAILNVPNGFLLDNSEVHSLAMETLSEGIEIARAWGISLPYSDPQMALDAVLRDTAGNISSMLQDIRRGSTTEIESICGILIQRARQVGVDTPTIETLYHLVKLHQPG